MVGSSRLKNLGLSSLEIPGGDAMNNSIGDRNNAKYSINVPGRVSRDLIFTNDIGSEQPSSQKDDPSLIKLEKLGFPPGEKYALPSPINPESLTFFADDAHDDGDDSLPLKIENSVSNGRGGTWGLKTLHSPRKIRIGKKVSSLAKGISQRQSRSGLFSEKGPVSNGTVPYLIF